MELCSGVSVWAIPNFRNLWPPLPRVLPSPSHGVTLFTLHSGCASTAAGLKRQQAIHKAGTNTFARAQTLMPFVTAAVAAEEGAPHKRDKTLEIVLAKQRGKGSDNGLCSGALRREADADWQTSA